MQRRDFIQPIFLLGLSIIGSFDQAINEPKGELQITRFDLAMLLLCSYNYSDQLVAGESSQNEVLKMERKKFDGDE